MAKRIIIEMKDGEKYVNDPGLGLNLDTVEAIREHLTDSDYYHLVTAHPVHGTPLYPGHLLHADKIARVYEEESPDPQPQKEE